MVDFTFKLMYAEKVKERSIRVYILKVISFNIYEFILFLLFMVVVRGSNKVINSKDSGLSYNWVDAIMNGYEVALSKYGINDRLNYHMQLRSKAYNMIEQ